MKNQNIIDALSLVDGELVDQAAPGKGSVRRARTLRLIALIVSAAILIAAVPFAASAMRRTPEEPPETVGAGEETTEAVKTSGTDETPDASASAGETTGKSESEPAAETGTVEESAVTVGQTEENNTAETPTAGYFAETPPAETPEEYYIVSPPICSLPGNMMENDPVAIIRITEILPSGAKQNDLKVHCQIVYTDPDHKDIAFARVAHASDEDKNRRCTEVRLPSSIKAFVQPGSLVYCSEIHSDWVNCACPFVDGKLVVDQDQCKLSDNDLWVMSSWIGLRKYKEQLPLLKMYQISTPPPFCENLPEKGIENGVTAEELIEFINWRDDYYQKYQAWWDREIICLHNGEKFVLVDRKDVTDDMWAKMKSTEEYFWELITDTNVWEPVPGTQNSYRLIES